MNPQDFRSLQEAYFGVYNKLDEGAAGDVAARAQKLANQRKQQTPERKQMYQSLADKARERERGPLQGGNTRKGITPRRATSSRESDANHDWDELPGRNKHGRHSGGAGSKPKNPEKYRRQVVRGVRSVSSQERKRLGVGESYDIYDLILSHLLDEGYAETQEAAETIMVHMSEDWRESIVEGLGGFQNPERVQKRLNKIEADIKKGEEMYASGQLPYQRREKAQKAQEFLKRHPKKKK